MERKFMKRMMKKISAAGMTLIFLAHTLGPCPAAAAQNVLNLPAPGAMVSLSPAFLPAMIKGVNIYPDNPFKFDFIIDKGDTHLTAGEFQKESKKLAKYFLAALTVPEDEMWVNLSPYEKDRIIPASFGKTEMGRDLLAQDYMLKQLSSSLMHPDGVLGKNFWDRVYARARDQFGSTEIPLNTFNKIWIVPQEADVYEHSKGAFVVKSHLKVMLEEEYAVNFPPDKGGLRGVLKATKPLLTSPCQGRDCSVSTDLIRDLLLPEVEKEVNEGKTFTDLRQIYNAVILASWYKQALKDSLLGKLYVNRKKTDGIDVPDPKINEKIYEQYLAAYKKGVYNFIREDLDPRNQEVIPRKYFSGGAEMKGTDQLTARRVGKGNLGGKSQRLPPNIAQAMTEVDGGVVTVEVGDAEGNTLSQSQQVNAKGIPLDPHVLALNLKPAQEMNIDSSMLGRIPVSGNPGYLPIIQQKNLPLPFSGIDKISIDKAMLTDEDVQRFGFTDVSQLPQLLQQQTITVGLPDSIQQGMEPISISIESGVMIPVQIPGNYIRGIVVTSDGKMLYVGHQNPNDPTTPLTAALVDVPEAYRNFTNAYMARAAHVDPQLIEIWEKIFSAWQQNFHMQPLVIQQSVGTFSDVQSAWNAIGKTIQSVVTSALQGGQPGLPIRTIVQTLDEFISPDGRETVLGDASAQEVQAMELIPYLTQELGQPLSQYLRNPSFDPRSTFHVFYESLASSTIRLVVIPSGRTLDLTEEIRGGEISSHAQTWRAAEIISKAHGYFQGQEQQSEDMKEFLALTTVSITRWERNTDIQLTPAGQSAIRLLFAERPLNFLQRAHWKFQTGGRVLIQDRNTVTLRLPNQGAFTITRIFQEGANDIYSITKDRAMLTLPPATGDEEVIKRVVALVSDIFSLPDETQGDLRTFLLQGTEDFEGLAREIFTKNAGRFSGVNQVIAMLIGSQVTAKYKNGLSIVSIQRKIQLLETSLGNFSIKGVLHIIHSQYQFQEKADQEEQLGMASSLGKETKEQAVVHIVDSIMNFFQLAQGTKIYFEAFLLGRISLDEAVKNLLEYRQFRNTRKTAVALLLAAQETVEFRLGGVGFTFIVNHLGNQKPLQEMYDGLARARPDFDEDQVMEIVQYVEALKKKHIDPLNASENPDNAVLGLESVPAVLDLWTMISSPDKSDDFTKGGVDLNPARMKVNLQKQGDGVDRPVSPAAMKNMQINGLTPVIIRTIPLHHNLPWILGFEMDDVEERQLAGQG